LVAVTIKFSIFEPDIFSCDVMEFGAGLEAFTSRPAIFCSLARATVFLGSMVNALR